MLVGKGFDSTNILLVGESAGAFEVLALLQYLKELRDEHKVDVGMPGGAAIVSVFYFFYSHIQSTYKCSSRPAIWHGLTTPLWKLTSAYRTIVVV
jgi:hypothetical protein